MTVKELIKALSNVDLNMEVVIMDNMDWTTYAPVDDLLEEGFYDTNGFFIEPKVKSELEKSEPELCKGRNYLKAIKLRPTVR